MPETHGRFPRGLRLLKPAEFETVFQRGSCRLSAPGITFIALPNAMGHPRLGIALSKRVVRRATGRNRLRRQFRESFRLHQQRVGGLDVVILARPGIDKLSVRALRATVDGSWQELAKRCEKS